MTDQRIERAYLRMLAAKSLQWQRAWGDGLIAQTSMRNAREAVRVVRIPSGSRGEPDGLRQVGQRPVEATSVLDTTTLFVVRPLVDGTP
jgi:hypothetical protein